MLKNEKKSWSIFYLTCLWAAVNRDYLLVLFSRALNIFNKNSEKNTLFDPSTRQSNLRASYLCSHPIKVHIKT